MTFWPLTTNVLKMTFHLRIVIVTSQPIRLSTNFKPIKPSLTFTDRANYEWFLWNICHGCDMPTRNAYPSGHLVPSPLFGTCFCSNFWDQISRTCRFFTRLFTFKTPRYFLDFALQVNLVTILNIWNKCIADKEIKYLFDRTNNISFANEIWDISNIWYAI